MLVQGQQHCDVLSLFHMLATWCYSSSHHTRDLGQEQLEQEKSHVGEEFALFGELSWYPIPKLLLTSHRSELGERLGNGGVLTIL